MTTGLVRVFAKKKKKKIRARRNNQRQRGKKRCSMQWKNKGRKPSDPKWKINPAIGRKWGMDKTYKSKEHRNLSVRSKEWQNISVSISLWVWRWEKDIVWGNCCQNARNNELWTLFYCVCVWVCWTLHSHRLLVCLAFLKGSFHQIDSLVWALRCKMLNAFPLIGLVRSNWLHFKDKCQSSI